MNTNGPGNIRELENAIERAMILCPGSVIRVDDLPPNIKKNTVDDSSLGWIPENATLSETLSRIEIKMIQRAMRMTNNVQAHAADLLGIGKSGLNQKIKKYNIQFDSKD